MDSIRQLVGFVLHFDEHLHGFLEQYGAWTYAILFLIIFCETGLVVTPVLPGDSLLFAAGMFAGLYPDALSIYLLLPLLTAAAILGDTVNYSFGAWIGPRAFSGKLWFLKQKHLLKTQAFYERYGGRAIVLGRFVPFARTFVPFVAGVGAMNYRRFIGYNVGGGIVWVGFFTLLGFFLGEMELVRKHFELVVLSIVFVSVLPMAWEILASWRRPRDNSAGDNPGANSVKQRESASVGEDE
jgi:membrane-associated protein